MNIVCIQSGLGNQMFQYAFFRALQQHRGDAYMDISQYAYRPSHNGYELEKLFYIQPQYATAEQRNQLVDVSKDFFSVCRRALGFTHTGTGHLREEPQGTIVRYDPTVWEENNCYFRGYWQSPKYFAAIEHLLREEFRFRLPLTSEADLHTLQLIEQTHSVSVHIRRGDYLKKRRKEDYEVCTPTYYQRAIKQMQKQAGNVRFFIFSDEIEWAEANIPFPADTVFVKGHSGEDAWKDMLLMSRCRHHIIANSSFSWWGAWLNPDPQKIVLAPDCWFRYRQRPDILPDTWQTIATE